MLVQEVSQSPVFELLYSVMLYDNNNKKRLNQPWEKTQSTGSKKNQMGCLHLSYASGVVWTVFISLFNDV